MNRRELLSTVGAVAAARLHGLSGITLAQDQKEMVTVVNDVTVTVSAPPPPPPPPPPSP